MVFRCLLFVVLAQSSVSLLAQNPAITNASPTTLPPRKLAPGVLTVVAPNFDQEDVALGPYDLDLVAKFPELAWTAPNFPENKPNFASPQETLVELSKQITFRPERIWGLEFAFKPVRVIELEIPNRRGVLEKQTAYYMVYALRNPGKAIRSQAPEQAESDIEVVELEGNPIRTLPRFQIVSKERQFMLDASIQPAMKAAIEAKERVGRPLLDHIEMSQIEIKPDGKPVWGVAIWMNVDPSTDFFAVDIRGLTNAYRMKEETTGELRYERKTLRIYHWRAGDSVDQANDRIRLGVPPYVGPSAAEAEELKKTRSQLISEVQAIKDELEKVRAEGGPGSGVAARLPELQKQISELNIALRMQDALDNFNLTERLDYQWIYR